MTAEALSSKEFLEQSKNELIVDVRAPLEFQKGHIINAVNVPLFDNYERAEIGTLFKKQGKDKAVTRGLEIVSPKLVNFLADVQKLTKNKKVFVYCFRGGMRSNSFAWLMNTGGLEAKILKGGYKAYRNHVLNYFVEDKKMILLGGRTGSGKTDVLRWLSDNNYPVIDIEQIAHHKGSAFGSINEKKQAPQQVFENNLFHELRNKETCNYYLLEDEAQSLGCNKIPFQLWHHMKNAPIIKLIIPFEARVEKLVQDYTTNDIPALKNAITKISQQLGPQNAKQCLQLLDEGKLHDVAAISLSYYDKAYEYKYDRKDQQIIEVSSGTTDAATNAELIKPIVESLKQHGN